jgi:uncharacterized protein YggE
MKTTLNTILTFLLFTTISFSQSGQKNFIDQPYIEVTGQVETEITPNEIYLRIVLNENDKKGRVSIEKQENKMLVKLKTLNLNLDKNLTVLDFNGFYQKKFLANNEVSKKKTYQLIVNNGKMLGEVYRILDKIDISNISIFKVSHSDIERLKRENKIKAIKTAKEKAQDYSAAIDQNIGKALFIQETQNFNNYRYDSNSLNEVVVMGYGTKKNKVEEITELNNKPILLKSTILARFSLN